MVPFILAAEKGHCDILQLLVAHGAKVNIQVKYAVFHANNMTMYYSCYDHGARMMWYSRPLQLV